MVAARQPSREYWPPQVSLALVVPLRKEHPGSWAWAAESVELV